MPPLQTRTTVWEPPFTVSQNSSDQSRYLHIKFREFGGSGPPKNLANSEVSLFLFLGQLTQHMLPNDLFLGEKAITACSETPAGKHSFSHPARSAKLDQPYCKKLQKAPFTDPPFLGIFCSLTAGSAAPLGATGSNPHRGPHGRCAEQQCLCNR